MIEFDIYELLTGVERETLNEIILEACTRKGYNPNDIDYDIKGVLLQ